MRRTDSAPSGAFSREWLALREDVDRRSRNGEVARTLAGRFALRDHVSVVDLGAGTGANLRATAEHLPQRQSWRLIDKDDALIDESRRLLKAWADRSEERDGRLFLTKGGSTIDVTFASIDLAGDLPRALDGAVDLITASAFFDLVSPSFIQQLARLMTEKRASLYATLTYNGVQRWSPHRPLDSQMSGAFHRHQLGDKGFGPAAGPTAPAHLADQFRVSGYSVIEGDSPWHLDRADRMLIDELVRGHAFAVAETGLVDSKAIEGWVKVQRTGADVGHTDTFAAPAG